MDSRKPLTAGEIEELKEEIRTMPYKEFFGENLQPLVDDHSRLLSLLPPPPDAAVREAVENLRRFVTDLEGCTSFQAGKSVIAMIERDIRTLLRAVQALVLEYGSADSPAIEALAAVWPEAVEEG